MELKSCPGCKGSNIRTELWGDWFATACQNCHWQTGFHNSEEESERAWNIRATYPLLKEMAEALDDLVFECDGVFNTRKPSRETYNKAFYVLQKYREQAGDTNAE